VTLFAIAHSEFRKAQILEIDPGRALFRARRTSLGAGGDLRRLRYVQRPRAISRRLFRE